MIDCGFVYSFKQSRDGKQERGGGAGERTTEAAITCFIVDVPHRT